MLTTVDPMTDPGAWTGHEPGGGASSHLTVAAGPAAADDLGTGGVRFTADAGAAGHFAQRTLPAPVDLSGAQDLQVWLAAEPGAGAPAAPVLDWELRLGSAALAPAAAGNDWARRITVAPAAAGPGPRCVLLSLDDLPGAVRGALTTLRITRVTPTGGELRIRLIEGLRERMLADVDDALVARLNERVQIEGTPVPAVAAETGVAPPAPPYLRVTNWDVRAARERSQQAQSRTDFTATGHALRPLREAYDLLYEVAAVAGSRTAEATLVEFVLSELSPVATLDVNHRPLPVELVPLPAALGSARPDRVTLWFSVRTSQRGRGAVEPGIPPYQLVDLEVNPRAVA